MFCRYSSAYNTNIRKHYYQNIQRLPHDRTSSSFYKPIPINSSIMKTTSIIFASLLALSASAAPVAPEASAVPAPVPKAAVSFSNDQTGAYARVEIPFGKTVQYIPDLLKGTSIDIFRDGSSFLASSVMLVGGLQYRPVCALQSNDGGLQAERIQRQLNAQRTYAKLGTPGSNMLEVVELRGAFLQCDTFPAQA